MNALRSELSWTHYRLLLKVEKEEARNFYIENKRIFASKYKLYLPSEKELRIELVKERERIETERKLSKK